MKIKKSKKIAIILSLSAGLAMPVWADPVEIDRIVDNSSETGGTYVSDATVKGLTSLDTYPEGTSYDITVQALAGTNHDNVTRSYAYGIFNVLPAGTIITGNNTITATATGGKVSSYYQAGEAMVSGILNTGTLITKNNTIVVTATRNEIDGQGGTRTAFAYGIENSSYGNITTENNTIKVTAIPGKISSSDSNGATVKADAFGITNHSILNTGNNTIEVTGIGGEIEYTADNSVYAAAEVNAYGIHNGSTHLSTAVMTTGDNTIKITAIGGKSTGTAMEITNSAVEVKIIGLYNEIGTMNTGNNKIIATGIGGEGFSTTSLSYDYSRVFGIVNAENLTTENNIIEVSATGGKSEYTGNAITTAMGIQNTKILTTGDNIITATATGGAGSASVASETNAYGIMNFYGPQNTGKNTITVTSVGGEGVHTGSSATTAYGIYTNFTMNTEENTIRAIAMGGIAEGNTGSSQASAVGMYSEGTNGNLTAVGSQNIYTEAVAGTLNGATARASAYALLARTGGTITLDSRGEAVKLTGDIGASGSSSIVLSLDNANSIWRPRFQDTYGGAVNGSFGSGSFTMQDGGVLDLAWHSNLNGYNFKDSQLNLTGDTIQIGDGATFIVNADLANNVADTISANTTATGTQYVRVAYDPSYLTYETVEGRALVLDFDGANGMGLASTVERPGSNVTFMPIMEGGYLVSLKRTEEPGIVGKTVSASYQQQINILRTQWSNLVQRLGDVRNENPESHNGSWARIHGGKLKSNGAYGRNSTMKYGGVQAGYDRMRETGSGKYLAGFLVDYIDADSDFQRGEGNTQSLAFGGYWTWLSPKGHYADVVVKAAHLDTDYDFYYLSGEKASADFTNWGYTMSVEYGYRHDLKKNRYIEPQAQFLVGHLESKNYRSSNGVSLHQDGVNLAMGRLGVLMGWTDENKSSAYVRGSVVRDFSGSGALTSSYEGAQMRIDTAGNTGTTFEVNMGASVIVGKNSHLYAELTKSFGGDVKTDWQANLGWRVKW